MSFGFQLPFEIQKRHLLGPSRLSGATFGDQKEARKKKPKGESHTHLRSSQGSKSKTKTVGKKKPETPRTHPVNSPSLKKKQKKHRENKNRGGGGGGGNRKKTGQKNEPTLGRFEATALQIRRAACRGHLLRRPRGRRGRPVQPVSGVR